MVNWDNVILGLIIIIATGIMSYIIPDPPLHSVQFLIACILISVSTGSGFLIVLMEAYSSEGKCQHA
jgi:hypothetical protein